MNAIIGFNDILSKMDLNPIQSKYLMNIKASAHSLLAIINDILDFSKIEAGKLEIINTNYNLRSLLDNIIAIFIILFQEKKLDFRFTIAENLPSNIIGDENRLRQILTNLISNALKYTNAGSVVFSSSLSSDHQSGYLQFDIQDTGIGIREEDVQKLFKPFEQLDTRKNRNVVGTGLGLAISDKLCQLMGGTLTLESKYGIGSKFSVVIPYIQAESIAIKTEDEEFEDFSAPTARVLVVDDIEINLDVADAILDSFDLKVDIAQSGKVGIELALKNEYDIIFMDHMMPEMDGIEAASRIRDIGGYCTTVPIIALTANVINGAESMFMDNKFSGFLPKPLEIISMNKCLRRFLPREKIEGAIK
jgi:CheY-like chemotaxis protein